MSDDPKWGLVPSANSPKKRQLPETTPNPEPKVVNNYFTVFINPQAILFIALIIFVIVAAFRYTPAMRA
jgi:hypothetical protein